MSIPGDARPRLADLLAVVSHDLREPTSTILLWEQLLRDRIEDLEVRRQALDAIRESAIQQSELIGTLADVSLVMRGEIELARERIALDTVLAAAIETQATRASERRVAMVADYKEPLGHVDGDKERLQRAFTTLINNAVRCSPRDARIAISARRKRGSIVTAIGCYVLGDKRHARPVPALELGVFVAGELIALHAGTLEVQRTGHAGVPTFLISLPIAAQR